MQIGVYTFVENTPDPATGQTQPATQRLRDLMEEIELADQVGLEVFGIRDGFKNLVAGDISQARQLSIADVTPTYNRGGSILGTSRTNPAKKDEDMLQVLTSFDQLGVEYLVTIGGDDTAFSGSQVYKRAGGKIKVAHVPKTIDNDLPLPPGIPTFGFETARHIGVRIHNLHWRKHAVIKALGGVQMRGQTSSL